MVNPGRAQRLVERLAGVEDPQQGPGHRGRDGRASGRADGEQQPAVRPEHERGRHRREGALPGRGQVRLAALEPEGVPGAGRGVEVVHLVVEEDARAGDDHARSELEVHGGGERHRVSLRVHHRDVGGVPGGRRGTRHPGRRRALQDPGPDLGGEGGRGHLPGRRVGAAREVGVAEPGGAPLEEDLLRLDEGVEESHARGADDRRGPPPRAPAAGRGRWRLRRRAAGTRPPGCPGSSPRGPLAPGSGTRRGRRRSGCRRARGPPPRSGRRADRGRRPRGRDPGVAGWRPGPSGRGASPARARRHPAGEEDPGSRPVPPEAALGGGRAAQVVAPPRRLPGPASPRAPRGRRACACRIDGRSRRIPSPRRGRPRRDHRTGRRADPACRRGGTCRRSRRRSPSRGSRWRRPGPRGPRTRAPALPLRSRNSRAPRPPGRRPRPPPRRPRSRPPGARRRRPRWPTGGRSPRLPARRRRRGRRAGRGGGTGPWPHG